MDLVRLAAVLAIAGSCGRASGDTGAHASGLAPPPGWRALPEIAAVIAAKAELDGVEAWGEPAKGCYAVWIAARGGGDLSGELLAALATERIATRDVVKPSGGTGLLAFSLERPPYRGEVRATVERDGVVALACYHNEREPAACAAACAAFLGAR